MNQIHWYAVDWGTSNLRAWAMDGQDQVIETYVSDKGMMALEPFEFEPHLLSLIEGSLPDGRTPVLVCGMAGAQQGWCEAPYVTAPCKPPSLERAVQVQTQDPRIAVKILPGIKQLDPADVMRGEETQLAGFLADQPDFDGMVLLPGTHAKWVRVSGQSIQSFQTFMTGELFGLIASQSVLKHSVATDEYDQDSFAQGLQLAFDDPSNLSAGLFALRAQGLVAEQTAAQARSRLSGLLIGSELRATAHLWQDRDIALLGKTAVAIQYEAALKLLGCRMQVYDTQALTLQGLRAAFHQTD